MKLSIIALLLILAGCGEDAHYSSVTLYHVDKSVLDEMCDETYECLGYAQWAGHTCNIYMMPREEYSLIDEYNRILGHEFDYHCVQKKEHPK